MKQYNFPKSARVKKERDFTPLLKDGRRTSDTLMTVYVRPNSLVYSRLGIIVSKKRVRNSTRRNYYKRLIREAFRLNKPALPPGWDILVNLKQFEGVTLSDITASLLKLTKSVTGLNGFNGNL